MCFQVSENCSKSRDQNKTLDNNHNKASDNNPNNNQTLDNNLNHSRISDNNLNLRVSKITLEHLVCLRLLICPVAPTLHQQFQHQQDPLTAGKQKMMEAFLVFFLKWIFSERETERIA